MQCSAAQPDSHQAVTQTRAASAVPPVVAPPQSRTTTPTGQGGGGEDKVGRDVTDSGCPLGRRARRGRGACLRALIGWRALAGRSRPRAGSAAAAAAWVLAGGFPEPRWPRLPAAPAAAAA